MPFYHFQKCLISQGVVKMTLVKLYDPRGGEPNDKDHEEERKEASQEG
jgi:hypothetical protein